MSISYIYIFFFSSLDTLIFLLFFLLFFFLFSTCFYLFVCFFLNKTNRYFEDPRREAGGMSSVGRKSPNTISTNSRQRYNYESDCEIQFILLAN